MQHFYNNVPVVPTSQQINDGTLVGPFCQMVNPTNSSCPISLETFETNNVVTQIRGCGHIFHNESIMSWFRNNTRCPVCRYDIRDYLPTDTTGEPFVHPLEPSVHPLEPSVHPLEHSLDPLEHSVHPLEPSSNSSEQINYPQPSQPISGSQNRNQERNSNSTSSRPLSTTANLTGLILSQLLSSVTGNRVNINNPQYIFDPSNNEIIMEGFLRDFD